MAWDLARAEEVTGIEDVAYDPALLAGFGRAIDRAGLRRIGIDPWELFSAHQHAALRQSAPSAEIVATDVLTALRRVKSPSEVQFLRRAAALAEQAMKTAFEAVHPGAHEYEIVLRCEETMRRGGDLQLGAATIAGCGPMSSTGSRVPTWDEGRELRAGEWILLDICPRVRGYSADVARVRLAGEEGDLDRRLRRLLAAAILINEEVRKAVRPGTTGRSLNALADDLARQEGVLQHKIDLLGHGLGIDVVDVPVFYADETPLSPGEIITIEPCLLLPGVGGVRIEDMVLVTADGSETLTSLDRGALPIAG